jgi:hypothetical protein
MNHVPEFIWENSSWFLHYSDLFAMDRIKTHNRSGGGGGGAPPSAPKKMLKGASLMAAMKSL